MDTTTVIHTAQTATSFGELAGVALILLVILVGVALVFNGWPGIIDKRK